MRIAQISDLHILADSPNAAAGASRVDNLKRCVTDINRQRVDAVIHTGDSAHFGTKEEYAIVREILAGLEAPMYLIPGNRDRRDIMRDAFGHLAYLPRNSKFVHYAVEAHPLRLVGLDSASPGDRKGAFCAERLAWLEETLARAPDRPTVLFIHHPPFDIVPHFVGGYRRQQDAENLTALVANHPQVVLLLCGHVHFAYREFWAGTTAITMPSVAVDLRMKIDGEAETAPLYLLHVTSEDGNLVSHEKVLAA